MEATHLQTTYLNMTSMRGFPKIGDPRQAPISHDPYCRDSQQAALTIVMASVWARKDVRHAALERSAASSTSMG